MAVRGRGGGAVPGGEHYGKGNLWKVSVALPKAGFLTAAAALGPFE